MIGTGTESRQKLMKREIKGFRKLGVQSEGGIKTRVNWTSREKNLSRGGGGEGLHGTAWGRTRWDERSRAKERVGNEEENTGETMKG